MKNKVTKFNSTTITQTLFFIVFFIMLSLASNAQCDTKIYDEDNDGKDFVCAGSVTTYSATRDEFDSELLWSLSDGGTIISVVDNGETSTVTIQWDNTPNSGPFCLTLTEHDTNNDCTGSDKIYVSIEKDNVVMACNSLVLVSLDNDCQAYVTGDMILEAPLYPNNSYTVTVFNNNFTPRTEPIVSMADLGDTLMVAVEHDCSGLRCMGNIAIQDKLATMLSCREDTIVLPCYEDVEPENSLVGFPLVEGSVVTKLDDNIYTAVIPGDCGGEFTLVYTDEVNSYACGGPYNVVVDRTWSAIDPSGNSWSCSEVIATKWADLDSMKMPCNFDGLNGRQYFQCNDPNPVNNSSIFWPFPDSIPGPEITGYPEFVSCGNIQYLYEDVVTEGCGYNKNIIRQWIVLDWCTGRSRMCDQVISFVDKNPPIFHLYNDTLKFDSNTYDCYGSAYPLPLPIVDYECSDWNYQVVGYVLDGDGNCSEELVNKENLFQDNTTGYYGIDSLPVDVPVCVVYKVTDECGYSSYGNVLVMIVDNQPPTASCETHTVVSLVENTKFYATSLDDASWDNCGIKSMEIKRKTNKCGYTSDLVFGDYVNLCCNDVSNQVTVILKVTDNSGNTSECEGYVTVIDNEDPVLVSCPGNFTISCDESYTNYFPGGKPVVTDNCDNISITYTDTPNLNDCGLGTVRRVWKIQDGSGNTPNGTCIQTITVEDGDPLTYDDVIWPNDTTLIGCFSQVNIDDSKTGIPEVLNTSCKNLGIAHVDEYVLNPESNNSCYQILRTFKIGDWCNPEMEYLTHTQIISINDGEAPTFVNCTTDTTVVADTDCSVDVGLTAWAVDDCTDAEDLEYSYKVDLGNDGTYDITGAGNYFNHSLERGNNKIVFSVVDGCGNVATCTRYVKVVDQKPPTPVCLLKLTTSLGSEGEVQFNASQFNRASYDNCTPSNYGPCECGTDLRFSFSDDISDSIRVYNCDSLLNGVGQTFDLQVYVWDLDNNTDYCLVTLNVLDTKNVCEDVPEPLFTITGNISDDEGHGMNAFDIYGIDFDFTDNTSAVTDEEGNYQLTSKAYDQYKIVADKEDQVLDGLTTLDIVLIQKHLLGLKKFDSPFQYIAADVNESNSVTASDILQLRRLILGINQTLPNDKTWKFLRADTEFDDPTAPWDYEDKYITDSMYYDLDSLDFIAVRLGDVNKTSTAFFQTSGMVFRDYSDKNFVIDDAQFNSDNLIPVTIKSEDKMNISGFQFTLNYDPTKLAFDGIVGKTLNFGSDNYNVLDANDGLLTVSWNSGSGIAIDANSDLFTIKFRTLGSGILSQSIELTSDFASSEIYSGDLEISNLDLRFEGKISDIFEVYQNTPNPFSENTEISFNLTTADDVTLKIYDSTGKLVLTKQGHYSIGKNTITINKEDLNLSGVYFYEISSELQTVRKKMVFIK